MPVKTELLYGIHPVHEALKAARRTFIEAYVDARRRGSRVGRIVARLEDADVPLRRTDAAGLDRLVGSVRHQGIVLRASIYVPLDMNWLSAQLASGSNPFVVLLDGIEDPHNLGAMLRTAVAAGVDAVVTTKNRCAPPSPAVAQVSAGALEHAALVQVTNLVDAIRRLKNQGLWFYGLAPQRAEPIFDCDLSGPVGLVVGREDKGLHALVRKNCDIMIGIPQLGSLDSLNASVAAAVAIYEVVRQRRYAQS